MVETPRLVLRFPSTGDLADLADLAEAGIHGPSYMPFLTPWTVEPPRERARAVLRWHWERWAAWRPELWNLDFVVVRDRVVVGTQGIGATDFAVVGEVRTGSWLGLAHQGAGIGTEMRAAVLHLAFAGLGARWARSMAFADNAASLGVSRALGYVDDGIGYVARQGSVAMERRLRLSCETWKATSRIPVQIRGLDACRDWFGAPEPALPAPVD
jgi:RimJ/RimL family protein N-acetyltransferase